MKASKKVTPPMTPKIEAALGLYEVCDNCRHSHETIVDEWGEKKRVPLALVYNDAFHTTLCRRCLAALIPDTGF